MRIVLAEPKVPFYLSSNTKNLNNLISSTECGLKLIVYIRFRTASLANLEMILPQQKCRGGLLLSVLC